MRTFAAAVQNGDMAKAATCVKGVALNAGGLAAISAEIKKEEPLHITLTETRAEIKGDTAIAFGKGTIKQGKSGKEEAFETRVNMVLVAGAWQIVPDGEKVKKNDDDVLNTFAYILTDAKIFERANQAAKATLCLSQMKQIGTAALILALDSNEKLAMKPATFQKSLIRYVKSPSVFKCPSHSGSSPSYALNASLAGLSMEKLKAPSETILFYEGADGKLAFRHDGRAVVCFADGHSKLVSVADAKKLRWKP